MRLLLILLTCCFAGLAHAETRFLRTLEDVPLAPGLTEAPAGAFAFDADSGRIEEAVAAGQVSVSELRAFYRASLPPLGWARRPEGPLAFARGPERLTLVLEKRSDGQTQVRYRLVTRMAPAGR